MKLLASLVTLFTITLHSYAQNVNLLYKYGVKAYVQGTFSPDAETKLQYPLTASTKGTELSSSTYVRPTIAFQIRNIKRNFHEFELSDLRIGQSDDITYQVYPLNVSVITAGYKKATTSIALRYEYIHVFMKKKRYKLVPSLGFSASPYYLRYNLQPYVTTQYPINSTYIGARLSVIPRMTYFFSRNFFFDLNVPLCIADIHHLNYNELNPSVPQALTNKNVFELNTIPSYFSVRAGLGIKL
jgi:hypothetical protein